MRSCGLFYTALAAILWKVESACSCFVFHSLRVLAANRRDIVKKGPLALASERRAA
jgi:hypothetical protein